MREKILNIVIEKYGFQSEGSIEELTLYEAVIDSLDIIELVMDVEKEFSVLIPDKFIESFNKDTKIKEVVDTLTKVVEDEEKNKG